MSKVRLTFLLVESKTKKMTVNSQYFLRALEARILTNFVEIVQIFELFCT